MSAPITDWMDEQEADADRWRAIAPFVDALRREMRRNAGTPLREAMIGLKEDVAFWTEWNRNKNAVIALLDEIDRQCPDTSPNANRPPRAG